MGLQQEIGFVPRRANAVQRALQQVAAVPSLSPVLKPAVTALDKMLHRVTGGKVSATAGLVAFPTIIVTTTGARSGEPRTAPLAAIPVHDDLALIGSNGGSGKMPNWVFNLRAHPEASISYSGRVVNVIAAEAAADQYEEAFAAAARIYAGFTGYRERADSTIPVFMLCAAAKEGQQGGSE
jgi:deazaflavin-dependent oxidoreductase (nitroreductase family)